MSALIKLLIAVICCFAVASTAFPNRDDFVEVNTGKKGAYMLAMQRCSPSSPWTLHGLWPQNGQFCSQEEFSERAVALIRPKLEKEWPSCPGNKGNVAFWKHEWSKHGTCARQTQLQYFATSLEMLQKFKGSCGHVVKGECRICLNADYTVC